MSGRHLVVWQPRSGGAPLERRFATEAAARKHAEALRKAGGTGEALPLRYLELWNGEQRTTTVTWGRRASTTPSRAKPTSTTAPRPSGKSTAAARAAIKAAKAKKPTASKPPTATSPRSSYRKPEGPGGTVQTR